MKVALLRRRRELVVVLHLTLAALSYVLAYVMRFDGRIPPEHVRPFFQSLIVLLLLRAGSFWVFRLYEGLWRYVSIWDLNSIILSVAASSATFAVLVINIAHLRPFPRSVIFIDALLLVCLLGGVRLARRIVREFDKIQREKRILIYGAGDAGELFVRDVKNNRFYNWDPIGFIDDDPAKVGRFIHGVKVLGTQADLPRIIGREQPHEVVIAIVRAEPGAIRSLVKSLEPFKVPIKVLPNLRDVIDGRISVSQLRNLALEDLLPRKSVDLDPEPVRQLINGRRILITGAGGSIGSELSRQVAEMGPAKLFLFERYENALFELGHALSRLYPACTYELVVGDIGDAARVERVFATALPDVVFHAAAHKHVPLMESNASEAVTNNIRGTRIVAEASQRHGVGEFVLISSDKAVNPSSVMGATKRVAEHLVRAVEQTRRTRFVVVRFGNVLGSNGSVTRLFADQIARGGPVTVTHPDMRRYFMLIPEAVQLVLHAAAAHDAGAIYALEMGEQLKVDDLARNLIRLSGFIPDDEIAITYVGLRPGEKLYEELAESSESLEPTEVAKVLRVKTLPLNRDWVLEHVAELERLAEAGMDADVLRELSIVVPTFRGSPDVQVAAGDRLTWPRGVA